MDQRVSGLGLPFNIHKAFTEELGRIRTQRLGWLAATTDSKDVFVTSRAKTAGIK